MPSLDAARATSGTVFEQARLEDARRATCKHEGRRPVGFEFAVRNDLYDNGALCGASEGDAQYDCPTDDTRAFVHVEIVAFAYAAPLIG